MKVKFPPWTLLPPLTAALAMLTFGELTAQDLRSRPLQRLIDCPSAGGPAAKSYEFNLTAYPEQGVLLGFTISPFSRFALGLSYGGTDLIGYSTPSWNPQPGLNASFRIINENVALPGMAVGFINQGYGSWDDSLSRYQYLPKGFYAAAGKNFILTGVCEFGLHGGATYNPTDGYPKRTDFFAATDLRFAEQFVLIAEYSLGLNDNKDGGFTQSRGFMHCAARWSFAERFAVELVLRDVLVNQLTDRRGGRGTGREVRVHYLESL